MNNELYHYGVKGMKWGTRKAQARLAKLTGRNREKISAKEADQFIQDVKVAKNIKNKSVREQFVRNNSKKTASGRLYADAVLTEAKHAKIKKFATTTAIAAGSIAAAPFISDAVGTLGRAVAPVVKPVAKGVGKTLFWWAK